MSVCVFNCRSLINKLSSFQSFVYSSDFTFVCLTETWLGDHVSDGEILPNGFVLYRKDRPRCGGGVLIAVKSCVPTSFVPSPPDLEVITIEVGTKHDFVVCSVYIPPESSACLISSLVLYLNGLVALYKSCIFVGDFNLPDINWSSLTGSSLSSVQSHISQSTHTKGNILDFVLTSPTVTLELIPCLPIISLLLLPYCACLRSCHKPSYVFDF